jgi:hypothetical protein
MIAIGKLMAIVAALVLALTTPMLAAAASAMDALDAMDAMDAQAHLTHTARGVRYARHYNDVQRMLDQCRGPVVADTRRWDKAFLLAQHDYCGGMWVLAMRRGDRLVVPRGPLSGRWVADGRVRVVHRGARVSAARGLGRLVAQTCFPHSNRIRLVGFRRP